MLCIQVLSRGRSGAGRNRQLGSNRETNLQRKALIWESAQLIETSYAMFRYLPDGFMWWMLLGGG